MYGRNKRIHLLELARFENKKKKVRKLEYFSSSFFYSSAFPRTAPIMSATSPISNSEPGHTVAETKSSIELVPQFLFVDSPLPTFLCFSSCSVLVSDLVSVCHGCCKYSGQHSCSQNCCYCDCFLIHHQSLEKQGYF